MPTLAASISVVIPTHDRLELLERAIASVLAQTLSPIEIIVVDDVGSPAARELVERLATAATIGLRYIDSSDRHTKSAGASRNIGAEVATGQILAFLDDDDYWNERYLEESSRVLMADGLGLVITCGFFQANGILVPAKAPTPQALQGTDAGMTGSNMLILRAAYEAVGGFDPLMWVSNDRDLFIRLRNSGVMMGICAEPLVIQDGRGTGHLSSRGERRAKGLERFLATHAGDLTFSDRRGTRRNIHRARTGPEHSPVERVLNTIALCFYANPSDYVQTIKRRVLQRQRSY